MTCHPPPNRREALAGLASLALAGATGPAMAAAEVNAGPVFRRGVSLWPWFALTQEYPAPRIDFAWPAFAPGRAVPTVDDLARLHRLGCDFVRLPVDPGPFLWFTGARRDELLDDVMRAVALARSAGLNVIVDIHPNDGTHHFNSSLFLDDPDGPGFAAYLGLVRALAERLAGLPPQSVALEPMNEPALPAGSPRWLLFQNRMLATIRHVAPQLWVVATGDFGSTLPGLAALQPLADERILYTFHLYEPYLFSHQGAVWMTGEPIYRYLNLVPWPASAGSRAETLAASHARLDRDASITASDRRRIGAELDQVLDQYFDARPDRWFIDGYMTQARRWADSHGVPPGRLLLGEFGALRTDATHAASRPADRARYIRDLRLSAEARGLPWCYWNLFDVFTLLRGDTDRRPDPQIVEALGLTGTAD